MKILLINPPLTGESTWGDFKSVGPLNPPLGLCYIASVLRDNNIETKIIDAYVLQLTIEQIIKEIKEYQADIIGITSVSTLFEDSKKLAKAIKKEFKLPIIIGGPHVTIFPHQAMENGVFDVGVIGEGEETIIELVSHFEKGLPLGKIKGIVFKDKNEICISEKRPPIIDLDKLSMPAIDLLPTLDHYYPQAFTYKKRPVGYILTSRGCPFSCIYCIRIMGKRFRTHTPERIIAEIKRLINDFGVKEIHFTDDCFAVDKNRIDKLCDLIVENKLKFRWKCITHANSLTYDLLKKMKQTGCWYIGVGVETGDQKMMNFIKKKLNLEHLKKVLGWAESLNIAVKGFFILGFPTETPSSINATIEFSKKNPFFAVSYNIAYLNPGSEMDRIAEDYGCVQRGSTSVAAYSDTVSFVPHGFTPEMLKKIQRDAYLEFYLRPKQLLKMLKLNKNIENYKRSVMTLFTIFKRVLKENLIGVMGFFKTKSAK